MELTPIKTLSEIYGTSEFIFTIDKIGFNKFDNAQLYITVTHPIIPVASYVINKPTGKQWKEVDPDINAHYIAVIHHYTEYGTYSLAPIAATELPAVSVQQDTGSEPLDNYLTTITHYNDLPQPDDIVFSGACVVLDPSVPNPSMLLDTEMGLFRVKVPKAIVLGRKITIDDINCHMVSVRVKRSPKRGTLKILNVAEAISEEQCVKLRNTKLDNSLITPTYHRDTPVPTHSSPTCDYRIGSEWTSEHYEGTLTITATEPINDGCLIWVQSNGVDTYFTSMEFEFRQFYEVKQTNWPIPVSPAGVLAKNVTTSNITIVHPTTQDIEDYMPLTIQEVTALSYHEIDVIPF